MNHVESDRRKRDPAAQAEWDATIAAIRAGIAEVEAGRTAPAREAIREIAMEFGLADPYRGTTHD